MYCDRQQLAEMIRKKFSLSVHPRSIERGPLQASKKGALKKGQDRELSSGVSAEEWSVRYEALRRQAVEEYHSLENGWEFGVAGSAAALWPGCMPAGRSCAKLRRSAVT